ncbi:MAG TPA: peptide-methionine (S)-S-oxide reductase [Candidatus Saccharimonadales bacterium]|nr:peptide-methionine (S)-S-oxide reductase [Candidatus Saccharimonadales bacterium]
MINNMVVSLGNFWEAEDFFIKVPGVTHTEVGYCGGTTSKPIYHNKGDYNDAVKLEFDPRVISQEELLSLVCEFAISYGLENPTVYFIDDKEFELFKNWQREMGHAYPESLELTFEPLNSYHVAENYHQKHLAKLRGESLEPVI